MEKLFLNRGVALVELLVAVAIILSVVVMVSAALQIATKLSRQNLHVAQANYLLTGEAERIRLLRDDSWQTNIVSYPATDFWSSAFKISSVASPVSRDSSDNIVAGGGTLDAGTKKFTITAAWPANGATTTRSLTFYLANLFTN